MRGVSIDLLFSVILSINVLAAYCPTTLSIASNDMLLLGTLVTALCSVRLGDTNPAYALDEAVFIAALMTVVTCLCIVVRCKCDKRNTEPICALIIAVFG